MKQDFADLIEQYAHGGEKLSLAIRGLTREDMLQAPAADQPGLGKWTIQQVVIHVTDSDLVCSDRLKRMIAEDNPTLIGYDENRFAKNLFYDDQSTEDAVKLLDLNRQVFTRVLRKLPPEAFERPGTHNERGRITVGTYLRSTVEHLQHHLKFIHAKRAAMGKEMW